MLTIFHQNIVEASRTVCRDSIAFGMTQVIIPLLEKVGELDTRFKCASPMPNEAYFQGMKTSCVNEFELTVILTQLVTVKAFEDVGCQESNLACYGHVIPHQAPHPLGDILIDSGPAQGLVSAHKVRQIFAQLVNQAASLLPCVATSIEVLYKEPYTVVKIFRGQDLLLFELVPAFFFPNEWPNSAAAWPEETNEWLTQNEAKVARDLGFYAQALPCPAALGDPSLFRLSFSTAEKFLLRATGRDKSIASSASFSNPGPGLAVFRKASERILRMLRESDKDDFYPVNSYHIKTVLLHECQRWPDPAAWSQEKLGERFLELLRDVILALDNQELPHFFVRECNLLRCYAPELLASAAGRLRAIYQDIVVSPSASIRLQC